MLSVCANVDWNLNSLPAVCCLLSATHALPVLVSPLLAPLLALTFGMLVHDSRLTALGVRNGAYSLLIVIAIGFLLGLAAAAVGSLEIGETDNAWPSDEMRHRGKAEGLIVGLAIALPSGE